MFTKLTQRPASSSEETYGSEATEKTIPFLRRLVDMLSENESVISFCPGCVKNGQVTLGRIVVHDRIKVENEILPRYFNHSSFASLRRQLNYFSFTRIGKGRQKGATYCNEGVIAIEDILRLRRRSTSVSNSVISDGSGLSTSDHRRESIQSLSAKAVSLSPKRSSTSALSQKVKSKRTFLDVSAQDSSNGSHHPIKKVRMGALNNTKDDESVLHINAPSMKPTLVSPVTSPHHSPSISPSGAPQVTLDLTVPTPQYQRTITSSLKATNEIASTVIRNVKDDVQQAQKNHSYSEDPDIIAGCRVLLSFSHGLRSLTA